MSRTAQLKSKDTKAGNSTGPQRRSGRRRPGVPKTAFGSPIQRKMVVGPSRDRFESQADRAASHVVSGVSGTPAISPLVNPGAQRQEEASEEELQRKTSKQEEDALQRKAKSPEDEALQRKAKSPEDEALQRMPKSSEEEPLQRDATAQSSPQVSSGVEAGIRAARGGGQSLDAGARGQMESGFGRDFGAVRVHNDARAHRMNSALNARAFTTGSDIFFSRGAFDPGTTAGQTLLAHELTHVVQQTAPGVVQASTVQREENAPTQNQPQGDPPKSRVWPDPAGSSRRSSKRGINLDGPNGLLYMLPKLEVPKFSRKTKGVTKFGSITGGLSGQAGTFIPRANFQWTGKGSRSVTDDDTGQTDNSTQVQIWERYVKANSQIADKLTEKFGKSKNKYTRGPDGPRVYYLQHKQTDARIFTLIGTVEEIARNSAVLRPSFGPTGGEKKFMQVDHYIEIQLGGAHAIENMWLLDADANQKSGRDIKNSVVEDLNKLVSDAEKDGFWGGTNPPRPARFKSWPEAGHIEFAEVKGTALNGAYWDKDDIAAGKQIDRLKELTPNQMKAAGLGLQPGDTPEGLSVFLSKDSAFRRVMKVKGDTLSYRGGSRRKAFIRGFDMQEATFHALEAESMQDDAQIATIKGKAFGKRTVKGPDGEKEKLVEAPNLEIPVLLRTQHGYESYLKRSYINEALKEAALKGASPVAFSEVGLTDAWELLARGTVTADNPLFSGFTFGITLIGDAVTLDVAIPLENLKLGPFKATEANLSIGVDNEGLIYAGDVAFELAGVGSGTLTADRQKLGGDFNFDIDAFDPAEVGITYENGSWSGSGNLGVKPGTIPYVETASVEVRLDDEGFYMKGTANLGGPGIPAGTTIDVEYDQATGLLKFGADVQFDTASIPGLSGASANIAVSRNAEGAWSVAGGGNASISLPYISGTARARYENGYVDVSGDAQISRSPLTGDVDFSLSNRPVDAEGNPVEGPPLEVYRIWGSGNASIAFGDYITGTVGIRFLEDGQTELVGTIALPPTIPLIDESKYNYDILDFPQVRVPIVGLTIPVIRRSFGVFAFIGGGIDARVTVGPGQLVGTQVTVTYNPDKPEEASISGGSTFEMSAGAEVGLTVTGGVGAGLGIVEATGEVGLRGALGLTLAGGGSILVNWTPAEGLSLDATVFGEASPKFRLSVVAEAKVVVDAFAWSGTLWERSWERVLAEIGPDMTWRAELPATWSEADGLDLDINNLEITKPDIDLFAFGKEVFDSLT